VSLESTTRTELRDNEKKLQHKNYVQSRVRGGSPVDSVGPTVKRKMT